MRNSNKKGFTIVELVVVVAVIAILAAVLIPTFSGIIAKANLSADQQAVTNMNKFAVMASAEKKFDKPSDMLKGIAAYGFNDGKMIPYSKDYSYAYNFEDNKVYLLDAADNAVYPEKNVDKSKLWGFYYNSVEGVIDGVKNYIAMANITNNVNFQQAFGDGSEYNIDLNGYFVDLGATGGSDKVTVTNGAYVSGIIAADSQKEDCTISTTITSGTTYKYVIFKDVNKDGLNNVTFEHCIFQNSTVKVYGNATFTNCTFTGGPTNRAAIETDANLSGNFEIKIDGCEFNNVGRGINIAGGNKNDCVRNVTINNCEFNGATAEKYLIQLGTVEPFTLSVTNCKFNALGNAPCVVRINEGIINCTDDDGNNAFNYETHIASKVSFSGNTFSGSISEDKYVDTDLIDTAATRDADTKLTAAMKK